MSEAPVEAALVALALAQGEAVEAGTAGTVSDVAQVDEVGSPGAGA